MRKLTLQDIKSKSQKTNGEINRAVVAFREKTKDQGWDMSRIRPRSNDEIKALNYIARTTLRNGLKTGSIQYDNERRVLVVDRYTKG
ncbi:hypothetical protein B5M42_006810 [Paenibacillus athensensis]|uniref:Uncharacterized protein n=1 Tax=Paenibacillus athensensis TaxID=1967502 RepID=A0A4Y8PZ93_9BACL|nr:hypothetical protein [Paenibacillus athensensis]MCD1258542.1 hypothetical protein [Paenibacillus athensensis]